MQHEAALARALAAAPAPYFEGPVPGEAPLSASAAVHGFGSGRHLNTDELSARRPDGYKVRPMPVRCALLTCGGEKVAALRPCCQCRPGASACGCRLHSPRGFGAHSDIFHA